MLDEPPSEPHAARASAATSKTGANLPLVILFIFFLPRVGLGSTDTHTLVATQPMDEQRTQRHTHCVYKQHRRSDTGCSGSPGGLICTKIRPRSTGEVLTYELACPPSHLMTSPTVNAPARELKKIAKPAISCGVPTRLRGLPRPRASQSVPSTSPPVPIPVLSM